ncbi:zinc finger, CCHC-type containing protein [Tanacetum coccineum]
MTSISHMDVKFLWGNSNYDYVCSESLGNSGGILCIWEASIFKKINTTVSDNFIAIYGTWLPTNSKILFIAIYAPQQTSCKRKLWDYISNIVGRWNGESIIMGDFNEVRSSEERYAKKWKMDHASFTTCRTISMAPEQEGSILFGLPGSRQQKFLVLRFFDVKEQQGIDRLNIKKLDGNIVQKHGGSKQVGFKQLGPGVETGVHGVHDEKRVWFEVELQGAQGDREAEVFQVSNDDTAVAQRRLEDKQPEEKTNTDRLVKEQKKEYQTGWKIKTGNVLDSCNQRSTQQCTKSGVAKHLGVSGLQQQNGLVKETNVTLLSKVRCFLIQSATGFKMPIDMLGFFGWLASIKQGMLEPVKVKSIFLGYRKRCRYGLQGDEFEVEPHGNVDHVVGSQEYREDSNEAAFAVAAVEKIYAHESLTFNNIVACEVISKWKAGLKDDMDARSDVYVLSNGCKKCSDDSDGYYWESTPVGSQEYQMVCTRLDIASADMGMLDKFNRGLQTNV